MTEYNVGNQGDFPTLATASKAVRAGDVLNIMPGVYKEKVAFNTPNVTWLAAPGAIVDGGWNGKTTESGFAPQVAVTGAGVVVDGLTVRNCPGRGMAVNADGVTVRNCRIDTTYQGGMIVGDSSGKTISGVLVEGCTLSNMSLSWVTEKNPSGVNGSLNIHNVVNSEFAGNLLHHGWGEGFNIGRGSNGLRLHGNVIHTTNHVLLYFNRSQNNIVEDNLLYHIPDPAYAAKDGDYSAAIVIGDESGTSVAKWPPSSGNVIRRNLIVNTGKLLQVRNNAHNYDTQLLDTVIENNTFVAGPVTRQGVMIQSNLKGRRHSGSRFSGNVIHFANAAQGADIGSFGQGSGIKFEGNIWTEKPPQSMQGDGDVYGDPQLVRPAARIDPDDFEIGNYRPVAGGMAAMMDAGALAPTIDPPEPPIEPPDEPGEPEPPELDYQWVIDALEGQRVNLETAGAAVGNALLELDNLIALLQRNIGPNGQGT